MGANLSRIIICDIEATCWETREEQGSRPNEIIEIGICELNLRTNQIENGSSYVIKPRFTKVSPFCTQLTGWTQEAVDEGADILPTIQQLGNDYKIGKDDVWASCGEFDRIKLSSNRQQRGSLGFLYDIKHFDNPFSVMRSHINIKTLFALKHRLHKEMGMDKMLECIGEKLEGRHHNGGDDALNIAKIVRHVLS